MLQCKIKVQMAKRINLYVRSRTNESNIASYCWIVQEQQREHIKSGIRGECNIYMAIFSKKMTFSYAVV